MRNIGGFSLDSEKKKTGRASALLSRFKVMQAIAAAVTSALLAGGCGSVITVIYSGEGQTDGNQTVETV